MRFLQGVSLLLLTCGGHAIQPHRYLQSLSTSNETVEEWTVFEGGSESELDMMVSGAAPCLNLITGGDAETGSLSDWEITDSGMIEFDSDGPFGSTRSYKMSGRNNVNSGPGQNIAVDCLQEGHQYLLTAQIKITDENDDDFICDKHTEWLDPNICPLFSIWVQTPEGVAKLNLGNDLIGTLEWIEGEWNAYNNVFTVDDRLASANVAYLYIRGPRPGVNIYFDDIAIVEYVGIDTRYNVWSAAPPPEGTTDTQCIASTVVDSHNATAEEHLITDKTFEHYNYSEPYDFSSACVVNNGDAESDHRDYWIPMGAEGGRILLHYLGSGEDATRSLMHVDRPDPNSGPGQENIDLGCFELGERYELKAKMKLLDENGFPVRCELNSTQTECDLSCAEFTFLYDMDGIEQYLPVPNSLSNPWIAEEFNEYYAIFEVTQEFLDAESVGFFFRGPRAGVIIVFDDVILDKYTGTADSTSVADTLDLDAPCFSLVVSGDTDTGDINDWEIKDVISGEIVENPDSPEGSSLSFQHKGRAHVSSGPGQDLNVTCLSQGKQYLLTAQIKIMDEIFGAYACDKYGVWLDPDFCPLFTIWVNEPDGHTARFNIGNDYFHHRVWHELEWNPYYAIFTVDERLASTDYAYLYLRGPRPNATMLFADVSIQEYVGTDTRYNFWTALSPNNAEIAYDFPDWQYPDTVSHDFRYMYYHYPYGNYGYWYGSTGLCTQLVQNGDAESGDMAGWEVLGTAGGTIVEHSEGPINSTKSFKHMGRIHFNSGPGQHFDLPCLELGKIYEVKAKIKLFDHNGFPFRCAGKLWGSSLSCPMFTIVLTLPTGEIRHIDKWNDIREVPWYANHFNEFHALFQVDLEMLGAVSAYWYFRGPRADVSIAFDDVSIMLYEHQITTANVVVKPPGCEELMYNGDAQSNSLSGWLGHDGNGLVTIAPTGPDGLGPSFKNIARSHATNGPGQIIDISCLELGRTYDVTAKFFLEDGLGDAFACDRIAGWNTPYHCPFFSVDVSQPWGQVKWNFHNQLTGPQVAGWNEFHTTFTVSTRIAYPNVAYAYFRGPARDLIIYFNEVKVTMIGESVEDDLEIPPLDPGFNCTEFCCEMVSNGDAESGNFDGWIIRPDGGGTLGVHDVGADGSTSSIIHMDRTTLNSGPGQFIDTGCLVIDELYEIQAKIMLLDENGDYTSCDKNANWNDDAFCPLFSIWGTHEDNVWGNFWFDVPNDDTSNWVADDFNVYRAIFQVNEELISALEASFMFRGVRAGVQIILDSVSLAPYNHVPDYVPDDYGMTLDFFASASTLDVNPFVQSTCDVPIINGDFETGDTTGWFVNHGGEISILHCEETGGQYCLRHSQRTSKYMGPKAILDLTCLEVGRTFNVFAQIKLMDPSWEPIGCDKLAGIYSHCPIFTMHYITASGEEKWRYVANDALTQWNSTSFNDFYGEFTVDDELAGATQAFFYFERPAAGMSIIIDNVEIKELLLEADEAYLEMSETCAKFVLNGNAESGELRGWTPRFGGELIHHGDGADLTAHSIMHTGRRSFVMGPKHELAMDCFVGGMAYSFEAKMKLIDDETGEPFECDKSKQWVDDLACPLLTFQVTLPDGTIKWLYFNNKTKGKWQADMWNFFQASFTIYETLAIATSGQFYIERVRAGVSILIDEVAISRDCSVLIPNSSAENDSVMPWYPHGGGEISIVPGGWSGLYTFAHTGRLYHYAGPTHMLDVHCLTIGSKYVFSTQFKLLDTLDGNVPFLCDKSANYASNDGCPFFTLVLYLPDEEDPVYLHYENIENINTGEWEADAFNYFETEFEVTEQIYNATSAKMIFDGPRPGISILFDEAKLDLRIEGDCGNLIPNGHFETDDELVGWSVEENGDLSIVQGGASLSGSSLMCSGRLATSDGPMSRISHMCMYEGLVYELTAYLKLTDENNVPFLCDKSAPYGDPLACPVLGIEMNTPTEFVMTHPANSVEDEWVADEWNEFRTIFVVSNDLANAEIAHFKFKGAAPGIKILIDEMRTELYRPDAVNCQQLIFNPNAEDGFTGAWIAYGGGYIDTIYDGDNSTQSFAHYARGGINSGPKQTIENVCLEVGQEYDLNARFKFVDGLGQPVGCDKYANWGDPDYCLLFTFELHSDSGMQRIHFGNHYGGPWVADEFNSFVSVVTIDEDMANADTIFFYVQGPSEEKTIIFDNVSLKLRD